MKKFPAIRYCTFPDKPPSIVCRPSPAPVLDHLHLQYAKTEVNLLRLASKMSGVHYSSCDSIYMYKYTYMYKRMTVCAVVNVGLPTCGTRPHGFGLYGVCVKSRMLKPILHQELLW